MPETRVAAPVKNVYAPGMDEPLDLEASLTTNATPGSAGRAWRERLHAALEKHTALTPEAMLDSLLTQLPNDPVGVFKAIVATLPKELDVQTQPQQQHLTMLRIVAQAKVRGIDLDALLEPALPPTVEAVAENALPDFLR